MIARRNIDQFPPEQFDAIITNAGGCGSHLKHYAKLLGDDPAYAARAHEWDRKVKDIHEWLGQIGIEAPRAKECGMRSAECGISGAGAGDGGSAKREMVVKRDQPLAHAVRGAHFEFFVPVTSHHVAPLPKGPLRALTPLQKSYIVDSSTVGRGVQRPN